MADRNLTLVLRARDEAQATLDRAQRLLKGYEQQIGSTNTMMQRLGDTAVHVAQVGLAAFGAAMAYSIKQAEESQRVHAQLNAVLKSTGGVAGVTAQAATQLADSLSLLTAYDDEAILSAENLLLTFTHIHADVFPKATEAVLDMATAMGEDLTATSIRVGKALQDPILGVTALRRVGVLLTEQQEEQIKQFIRVNDRASAQAVILKELQTEFGGSAKAAGDTFAGQLKILRTQLDNVAEALGRSVMPALQGLTTFLNSANFNEFIARIEDIPVTFLRMSSLVQLAAIDLRQNVVGTLRGMAAEAADLIAKIQNPFALEAPSGNIPSRHNEILVPNEAGGFDIGHAGQAGGADIRRGTGQMEAGFTAERQAIIDRTNAAISDIRAKQEAAQAAAGIGGPRTGEEDLAAISKGVKDVTDKLKEMLPTMEQLNRHNAFIAWREEQKKMLESGDLQAVITAFEAIGKNADETANEIIRMWDEIAAAAKQTEAELARIREHGQREVEDYFRSQEEARLAIVKAAADEELRIRQEALDYYVKDMVKQEQWAADQALEIKRQQVITQRAITDIAKRNLDRETASERQQELEADVDRIRNQLDPTNSSFVGYGREYLGLVAALQTALSRLTIKVDGQVFGRVAGQSQSDLSTLLARMNA